MTDGVSIRPGVGMLGLFPHMKYRAWYAVGELVDNAIQSYLANRDRLRDVSDAGYKLRVEIELDKDDGGHVVVRDNAAGIASSDWGRAFKVAEPPTDATGLSQFGIGMKAACCWFAKKWALRTTSLGEDVIRSVVFDVPQIIASRDETLAVTDEPTDWGTHFTEIRMWDLHRVPQTRTLGKMRSYLGSMYREFLRNGDVEIVFDGDPVTYDEPQILNVPRWNEPEGPPVEWRKDVDVRLQSGRRVRGFVAVREKGSTSEAGLALLYRGKVVTGAGEEMYKPDEIFGRSNSFRSQRVFGELAMDAFAVTYTKDALVWYDEEDEFLELLRSELDEEPVPLLRQAENYRVRRPEPVHREIVNDVLGRIVDVLPAELKIDDLVSLSDEDSASGEGTEPVAPEEEEQQEGEYAGVDRTVTLHVNSRPWHVQLRMVMSEARSAWLDVHRHDQIGESSVEITVNRAHPFMRNFAEIPAQDLEPVWRLAISMGLAQELARDSGDKAGFVIFHLNELLRDYLGRQN